MTDDIRWKQRYNNFKKAIAQLTEFVNKKDLNKFEQQGLVQCFEYTYELGWKTLKDYLEETGFSPKTSRETIQLAYKVQLVNNGHMWINALEKRNMMAHTYNEEYANEATKLIFDSYYYLLLDLFNTLSEKL